MPKTSGAPKTPWIGTNWKMHKTRGEARAFAQALRASGVATSGRARLFVIPPFTAIAEVASVLEGTDVIVGAQDMHWADEGPYTGEISPVMIKDAGATLAEIGHSERRTLFGETDETVALKTESAVRHGLLALVCVGDTRAEYEAGRTGDVLARQVRAALSRVPPDGFSLILLAYEPVWSIGEGGTPAPPDFAEEQHALIKAVTRETTPDPIPVLYGGSVNPGNCRELAEQPDIDGLFVGRSAWRAEGLIGIVESVTRHLAER